MFNCVFLKKMEKLGWGGGEEGGVGRERGLRYKVFFWWGGGLRVVKKGMEKRSEGGLT